MRHLPSAYRLRTDFACDNISWMAGRSLILATLLVLSIFGYAWWDQTMSLTREETLLFDHLDKSIAHEPPRVADIAEAFQLPHSCRTETCDFNNGRVGSMHFAKGSLRQQDDGLIFMIEEFSNTCIRTSRVRSYFSTKEPEQSCMDSTCWYTEAQHSWGILTFKVNEPSSRCISSVVINSEPYQRPQS
jgi:hypothetical protein